MLVALLLAACSEGLVPAVDPPGPAAPVEEPAAPAADPVAEPSPYVYEGEGEAGDPVYDAEGLADSLQAAIDRVPKLRAEPAVEAYRLAMLSARPTCPRTYADGTSAQFWMDTCSTAEGASFEGYSTWYAYEDHSMGGATLWDGDVLWGNARISTPQGYRFEGGGTLYDLHGEGEVEGKSFEAWYGVVSGVFGWNGPGADGTWLVDTVTPAVRAIWTRFVESEGRRAEVEGSVPLADVPMTSATFTAIQLADTVLGAACDLEPSGSVSLRDGSGYWYDVTFHGAEAEEALCDGCGTVTFRGEVVGEVCVDWSPWLEWGALPW